MVPAMAAPIAYLTRVGPKPLAFGAVPKPLGEVLAKLPPLATDLPPRPGGGTASTSDEPSPDGVTLWPVPFQNDTDPSVDFPRLPDNWLESLLGNGLSPFDNNPAPSAQDQGGTALDDPSASGLTPENLMRFFIRPGSQKSSGIAIPIPFIPGIPARPNSSSSVFRQD